jgi:hypothetical protein
MWKCHKENPSTATLNKEKCLFSIVENRKVKQVLSRGNGTSVGVGGGEYKERVHKGEYGANTVFTCM